ncbi:mucin-2-like [Lytechinus pictus]|uniref:mucin-2-like n=1 Tax=Lytechinus pictus TaxID=7653 RepID=UPI0030B9D908
MSVLLVQKWVQAPKTNAFCDSSTQSGYYICRRPDCTSSPCLHGGTCMETRSSYRCQCMHGTNGSNCQHVTTQTSPSVTTTTPSAELSASTHLMTTSPPDVPTGINTADMSTCSPTDSTCNPTDSSTGSPTDPSTGSPTEPSTGSPTDPSTGSPTDPSTGPPTDPSTGPPTDPSTGSPTDPSTTPPSYQGKEYGLSSSAFTPMAFEDARDACTGPFGQPSGYDPGLIELTDDVEKKFIIDFISETAIPSGSSLWIGCPKYLSGDPEHGFYCYNSNYRYSSNNNIDIGYWDWDTDEPKKSGRRCMVLNLTTQKYRAEYCDSAAAIALCEWTPQAN